MAIQDKQISATVRPNQKVVAALRTVRAMGLARHLGTAGPELVEYFRNGSNGLHADHGYVGDTAAHWARAGMQLEAGDIETAHTRSLRDNVRVGKLTDEDGALLDRYRGTLLESGLTGWLAQIDRYASDPTLTRINVAYGGAHVAEHVDPPDQNMIQCLIEGDTVFEFRTRAGRHIYEMKVGDIWWFNTAWPHRTHIRGTGRRLLLHTRAVLRREYLDRPETPPTACLAPDDAIGEVRT
ncbi:MAG: hypothetical protein VYB54_06650 [Pseudomonadota bacterium]|nr:hypothetical protein [Pseudomonadota bacterium]